jgi:hypothetical protein
MLFVNFKFDISYLLYLLIVLYNLVDSISNVTKEFLTNLTQIHQMN